MSKSSIQEQRELLSLQADLVRLKMAVAQKRQQQEALGQTDQLLTLLAGSAEKIGTRPLLWRAVLLPAKWRHRVLLGGALLLWQWWRNPPR